ncbi:putative F-box protein [Acanthamoeba polyphaga mimivirus]|uniref:F-box protein n=1 Tax=Acanthamoeba polyphaga mimivirus Kroon TaxID=3069720 RepID=A0A0G2Y707_9VIRU|nr:putative F-box protein [Acanthamoeba polyphaga mimivirus]AKI80374.1 putative F-box protein [Acanthamoeba polyphaga mimivirus Kroon]
MCFLTDKEKGKFCLTCRDLLKLLKDVKFNDPVNKNNIEHLSYKKNFNCTYKISTVQDTNNKPISCFEVDFPNNKPTIIQQVVLPTNQTGNTFTFCLDENALEKLLEHQDKVNKAITLIEQSRIEKKSKKYAKLSLIRKPRPYHH